jgi:hypothetical protein
MNTDRLIGAFIGFGLTGTLFTFIIVQGFASKDFLRMNNIYLDGKMYKLCRVK